MATTLPSAETTGKPKRDNKRPTNWTPYMFLAVPLIIYFMWIIGPTFYTIYLSFTSWGGVDPYPTLHGVDNDNSIFYNYDRLFHTPAETIENLQEGDDIFRALADDRDFGTALRNNLRWLLVFITVPTTIGLGLAMIFNNDMRGSRIFKVSFYSPLVLSYPVIGLIWLWVFNPELGLLNSALAGLGVPDRDLPGWISDRSLAIWAIIIPAVWRQCGYVMILYLAGLKNIDPTLVDAARVDGANRWVLFRRVILPLLAPITTIIIVISIIDSLRSFDLVQVMTRGNNGTEVLANFMYMEAFNNYQMGYGAAIAVVLFAISLVFIGFYLQRTFKNELEY